VPFAASATSRHGFLAYAEVAGGPHVPASSVYPEITRSVSDEGLRTGRRLRVAHCSGRRRARDRRRLLAGRRRALPASPTGGGGSYSIETPRLLLNSACSRFPDGLCNNEDLVGRYLMVQGAPQTAGRFVEEVRMYKTPPPGVSSEAFYETDPSKDYPARLLGADRGGQDDRPTMLVGEDRPVRLRLEPRQGSRPGVGSRWGRSKRMNRSDELTQRHGGDHVSPSVGLLVGNRRRFARCGVAPSHLPGRSAHGLPAGRHGSRRYDEGGDGPDPGGPGRHVLRASTAADEPATGGRTATGESARRRQAVPGPRRAAGGDGRGGDHRRHEAGDAELRGPGHGQARAQVGPQPPRLRPGGLPALLRHPRHGRRLVPLVLAGRPHRAPGLDPGRRRHLHRHLGLRLHAQLPVELRHVLRHGPGSRRDAAHHLLAHG